MRKNASLWVTWSQQLDHWFQLNHVCCHVSHLSRERLRLLSGLQCLSVVNGPGRLQPTACSKWSVGAKFSSEPRLKTAGQACCVCTVSASFHRQNKSCLNLQIRHGFLKILRQWVNRRCPSGFSKRLRHCLFCKWLPAQYTVDSGAIQPISVWREFPPKTKKLWRISSQLRKAG